MSVTATVAMTCTVAEILAANTGSASAANRTCTHSLYNYAATLNGASTPPATKVACFEQALVAGAATIDLTALTGTNAGVITMLGLKCQVVKFQAKATNSNPITITAGASNGYDLGGAAWSVVLLPGQAVMYLGNDAVEDVASGAKTIDLAGTGTESVECVVLCG